VKPQRIIPITTPSGSQPAAQGEAAGLGTKPSATKIDSPQQVRAKTEQILELIRPAIQADGGDLELVEITSEGVARIRLHGACVGCPSSVITLQAGVERNLMQHVPEIRAVEAVD
jgi:Fe-S cluster biogenesis protein NfuA